MKKWIVGTFSDGHNMPSFKRQLALLATIMLGVAIFKDYPSTTIDTLSFLIAGILGITGVEKFSKPNPPQA